MPTFSDAPFFFDRRAGTHIEPEASVNGVGVSLHFLTHV